MAKQIRSVRGVHDERGYVPHDERMRRLEDMHGQVSLGDRVWAVERIRTLTQALDERHGEHYGPYGAHCMNMGQLDAGLCWKCQIEELVNQQKVLKEQLSIWKRKAGENQLVAGRYQYLFEEAMKAVNKIEDLFEYAYAVMHPTEIRKVIHESLEKFTEAATKVRRGPAEINKPK